MMAAPTLPPPSASSLGPANQQLWAKKPVMINKHVFVLPSRKSSHLDQFISRVPVNTMNVSDVNERSDTTLSCVIGSATWCTSNTDGDGGIVVCISLKDLTTKREVKVHLKGSVTDQFPFRDVNGGHLYLYGAGAQENVDFETQSQDCILTLLMDGSNPKACLVIVRKWLYMRLVNKEGHSLVDGLPNPLTGAIPKPASSPSRDKEKDLVKLKQASSSNVTSKAKRPRIVDSDEEEPSVADSEEIPSSRPPARSQETRKKRGKGEEERSAPVSSKGYEYVELAKLERMGVNAKANVCGVVKFFKPHYRTRGTDYCASFTFVDPSSPTNGTNCIFFNKSEEKLPTFFRVGDIVLLRRVKINRFQNAPQAVGQFYSSFHVFDGRCDSSLTPRMSSQGASLSDNDRKAVKKLREWASAREDISPQGRLCTLEKVHSGLSFDLVAQVVSVMCTAPDKSMCVGICDGTMCPFPVSKITSTNMSVDFDEELMECYGDYVVDVNIYDELTTQVADISPGDYIFFHGIHANPIYTCTESGEQVNVVDLCIHRDTRKGVAYSILDENDPDVTTLKEQLRSLSSSSAHQSVETQDITKIRPSVTRSLHPSCPFSSLQDVLTCEQVPNMFRCIVQAAGIYPSSIADLVQLRCPTCLLQANMAHTEEEVGKGGLFSPGDACPSCSKTSMECPELEYMYVFVLELVDETGVLEAFVVEEDSSLFFKDLPPTNFHLDIGARVKVWTRLQRLFNCDPFDCTAVRETSDTRPYMDCCVLSYYPGGMPKEEEERKKAQVSFRIFDTLLLDDSH